jgi:hypothetical protein
VRAKLFAEHGFAPDQLDAMLGIEFTQGQQGSSYGSRGGEVAPHSIQRYSRQGSTFPRRDPLLAGVVAALATDPVRALGRLAAGAELQHNRRSLLVRIARALLALRRSSLRDGHYRDS